MTVGVYHRMEELADLPCGARPDSVGPFASLILLPEALSELLCAGPGSKRVQSEYLRLLQQLGPELTILQGLPLEEIAAGGDALLVEGIRRMRAGEVRMQSGYDGEYGVISLFDGEEDRASVFQLGRMFAVEPAAPQRQPPGESEEAVRERQAAPSARRSKSGDGESRPPAPCRVADGLAHLDTAQRAAATHADGPLAIVAGPGTGKTRTLTVRMVYLVEARGAEPASMLALTFTNKAASEMRERPADRLGADPLRAITVCTFHQLGAGLLRAQGTAAGISPSFAIADDEDRHRLLQRVAPDLSAGEVHAELEAISTAKNALALVDARSGLLFPDNLAPDRSAIRERYDAALAEVGALDLNDLVYRTVRLLETDPAVLQTVQPRFRWISVDEYQDVNAAQYGLLRLLADGGANLCVIGDPDQAIYGFRGADHRYFLSFVEDLPGAKQLRLERDYRFAQAILDVAAQVIARNPDHQAVELLAEFAEQVKLEVHRASTDSADAEYVVHQVERMVCGTSYFSLDSGRVGDDEPNEQRAFGDFAVLYRLNA